MNFMEGREGCADLEHMCSPTPMAATLLPHRSDLLFPRLSYQQAGFNEDDVYLGVLELQITHSF